VGLTQTLDRRAREILSRCWTSTKGALILETLIHTHIKYFTVCSAKCIKVHCKVIACIRQAPVKNDVKLTNIVT